MADASNGTPGREESTGRSTGAKVLIGAGVLAVVLAVGVGGYVLFAPGKAATGKVLACQPDRTNMEDSGCPPKGAPYVDGLVQKASGGTFTITPMGGASGRPRKLYVRAPDRPYIDVAHAQTHASLGQPVRVYTKRVGGRDAVIYMVDSPLMG